MSVEPTPAGTAVPSAWFQSQSYANLSNIQNIYIFFRLSVFKAADWYDEDAIVAAICPLPDPRNHRHKRRCTHSFGIYIG